MNEHVLPARPLAGSATLAVLALRINVRRLDVFDSDVFRRMFLLMACMGSCVEAMAWGLPVIASPAGGMAEMLEDGGTGWIAASQSPPDLASALRRARSRMRGTMC